MKLSNNSYLTKIKQNILTIFGKISIDEEPKKLVEKNEIDEKSKSLNYVFSFIALAAKIAEADAPLSNDELRSIIHNFPSSANFNLALEKLIIAATNEKNHFSHHAEKIKKFFKGHHFLFVETIDAFIKIALSDGHINRQEMKILQEVARIFKINNSEFMFILKKNLKMNWPQNETPYGILQIKKNDEIENLTKKYHDLVKPCHPDNIENIEELDPQYLDLLEEKFQRITEAYQEIKKKIK